jgi:hypothetical protein
MANDPLSQYRRTTGVPSMNASGSLPPDEYAAFGTKDRVRRLRIRSTAAPVNAPGYNILLNVVSDGQDGTNFILVYSVLLVLVRGRNLQKMVFAIENEMADYIQEFDPDKWQKPTDATAPLIESIEIKAVERGSSNTDTQH